MIALSHRAAHIPLEWRRWLRRRLARTGAILTMIIETFAASQDMQRAAHRRFPFAEW